MRGARPRQRVSAAHTLIATPSRRPERCLYMWVGPCVYVNCAGGPEGRALLGCASDYLFGLTVAAPVHTQVARRFQ